MSGDHDSLHYKIMDKAEYANENQQRSTLEGTFSKEIEAVSPDVSMATTSGSGLGTGRMCFECT